MLISEFQLWQPGYAGAIVRVYIAGTTTLASLFSNEALTVAAANPQTLSTLTSNGVNYGKFSVPLYTGSSYYLDIDSGDQTGIERIALTTLAGQNASDAVVTPDGATVAIPLDEFLDRFVFAEDYGAIGTTAATNNATLTAAIGAVASRAGGVVYVPNNQSIPFTQLTVPVGVVLEGYGRTGNPTLMSSTVGGNVITLSGNGAGLRNIVLDGISKQAGSVGVYSVANDETVFDNVLIKRFATGGHFKGGRRNNWREFYIDGCTNGMKHHGDVDVAGGSLGDQWANNRWSGGRISTCTGIGLDLSYEDRQVRENTIENVGFEDNTGTATRINGARMTGFPGCWWTRNTADLAVLDDSDTSQTDNTVIGLRFGPDGSIAGGTVTSTSAFSGLCQDVTFDKMLLSKTTITLTTPSNNILWRDCVESSDVTLAGNGTRIVREQTVFADAPTSAVVTTNATTTKAWEVSLNPGEVGQIEARVVGTQRNGTGYATYHIARPVRRPGSALAYDAQTANFTLGAVLTGATSAATARIIADADAGATGTLTLKDIIGIFIDGEVITDSSGGSANANGVLVPANAALIGATTSIEVAVETDAAWGCDFAFASGNIEVQVTGAAGAVIEWTASASVTLN